MSANEEDPVHGEKEESTEGMQISSIFPVEVGRSQLRSTGGKPRSNSIRKTGCSGDSLAMPNVSEPLRKANRALAFISEQKTDHSSLEQLGRKRGSARPARIIESTIRETNLWPLWLSTTIK